MWFLNYTSSWYDRKKATKLSQNAGSKESDQRSDQRKKQDLRAKKSWEIVRRLSEEDDPQSKVWPRKFPYFSVEPLGVILIFFQIPKILKLRFTAIY